MSPQVVRTTPAQTPKESVRTTPSPAPSPAVRTTPSSTSSKTTPTAKPSTTNTPLDPFRAITASSRINLGPLTETFTPPADCVSLVGITNNTSIAWLGRACSSGSLRIPTSCWPPTSSGAPAPSSSFSGWGFYSPGLACPSGYVSACAATFAGFSEWDIQFPITSGETAVGCCPNNYKCRNINGATCFHVPTSTVVQVEKCDGGLTQLTVESTDVGKHNFYAPMVQIYWHSSDLQSASTSSSSPESTSTSASQPGIYLSPGKIGGIVIGGLLVLVGFIWITWYCSRRSKGAPEEAKALMSKPTPPSNDDIDDFLKLRNFNITINSNSSSNVKQTSDSLPVTTSQTGRVDSGFSDLTYQGTFERV